MGEDVYDQSICTGGGVDAINGYGADVASLLQTTSQGVRRN
jgi:hypothetical protein